ncbi:hypothetical protein QEN19_001210 [Hanseniaspora menglaensis]
MSSLTGNNSVIYKKEIINGAKFPITVVGLSKQYVLDNIKYQYNNNNEIVDIQNKDTLFKLELSCKMIPITNPKFFNTILKKFSNTGDVLKLPGVASIYHEKQTGEKSIILSPWQKNISDLSIDFQSFLLQENIVDANSAELPEHIITFPYEYWSSNDIMEILLPELQKKFNIKTSEDTINSPVSFTTTGDIGHMNIKSYFDPIRFLIGQLILDKNPQLNKVVNKLKTINSKFRTFTMEVLASNVTPFPASSNPEDMEKDEKFKDFFRCEHKESNCNFVLDFSKVYWNSRLHTEHERLVNSFRAYEVVVDVMAGVGPFSCPSGKKGVFVISNDLNPHSFEYMKNNVERNNVLNYVQCINQDGADVIKNILKYMEDFRKRSIFNDKGELILKKYVKNEQKKRILQEEVIVVPRLPSHFVMNLPDSAIEFLHNFKGIYNSLSEPQITKLPFVHVHCFEKYGQNEEITETEIQYRVYQRILKQFDLLENNRIINFADFKFHEVRRVAPCKPMFCVSFQLPKEIVKTN